MVIFVNGRACVNHGNSFMGMNDFEVLKKLLERDRSIRRFRQEPVATATLLDLVGLTRLCASGANRQPLVYALANEPALLDAVFPALKWAGYYKDWDGPAESERPTAYIVQALDTDITKNPLCDDGIQLQAITLGAAAIGLGGCIIKSFNAQIVREIFGMTENIVPLYVLALGAPGETSLIVPQRDSSDIFYYRDGEDRQCVPKRPLSDIIFSINRNHGL